MAKSKVFIDPSSRILYSSYYIQGLYDLFGKRNVFFSSKYFKGLQRRDESHSFDHYMAFVVVKDDGQPLKIIIDFRDKPSVKESAYEWCDSYAKINYNKQLTHQRFRSKMISIPPGFGIRIWSFQETVFQCVSNYFKCGFNPLGSLKNHLADYYAQYKRPLLSEYRTIKGADSSEPYIFMIATLWTNKGAAGGVNLMRRIFIELIRKIAVPFEGGFLASPDHPQYDEYEEITFQREYTIHEYITKTKLSNFVFNTPAVHNCHGWKLGEYLAMGKAIISMPVLNELPELLLHGNNIHFVDSTEALDDAVRLLLSDKQYVKTLEEGAQRYYSQYASPEMVIRSIIKMME